MGRLINADLLEENMKDYQMDMVAKATEMHVIRNEPTAYDVEAVVKEVQDVGTRFCTIAHCNNECENCDHGLTMKAVIKIVRNGGVK